MEGAASYPGRSPYLSGRTGLVIQQCMTKGMEKSAEAIVPVEQGRAEPLLQGDSLESLERHGAAARRGLPDGPT